MTPGSVRRNALGPAYEKAEELGRKMIGVAVALDMRSRRQTPEIEAEMRRILLADIAQIETGLAEVKAAIEGAPAEAPEREVRR